MSHIFLDDYLALIQEARAVLSSIDACADPKHVSNEDIELCILKDHVWKYNEATPKSRIATSALFTYLSPMSRHALGFNCNTRQTMQDTVLNKKEGSNQPYAVALENLDEEDGVAMTTNRQTYFW